MVRVCTAWVLLLSGFGVCHAQERAAGLQVERWYDLGAKAPAGAGTSGLDMAPPAPASEDITVYGRRRDREPDWRGAIAAGAPIYEAAGSVAAQRVVPYREWDDAEEQRLMSIKSDWLGICGALGGYIQCPNKP